MKAIRNVQFYTAPLAAKFVVTNGKRIVACVDGEAQAKMIAQVKNAQGKQAKLSEHSQN